MENLFDYATKELSQDAFLRWLFQNYDDPVVGEVSNCLLGEFCHFQDGEKVGSLHTEAQKNKIDISAWITNILLADDCKIAIKEAIKENLSIDWYRKDSVLSKIRVALTDALCKFNMDRFDAKMHASRIVDTILDEIKKL